MSNMASRKSDDQWKEIADRAKSSGSKAGPTVQEMVARIDTLWPFESAVGVFDNGCGWGSLITHVLERYGSRIPPTALLIAGDLSDSMLQVLRGKKEINVTTASQNANYGAWKRLSVQSIDAQDLSTISSSSLSHITAGHLYFLLPDPQRALAESLRVLVPGGVTALTTGKSSQHIDALCSAVETVKPGTNLQLLKEPWCSEESIKKELTKAGFIDVETHLHESSLKYSDHGEFADTLLLMPVLKDVLDGLSADEKQWLREQLVQNLKTMNAAREGFLTGVGITTLARKRKE